jgi:GH18 family chitinase
MITKAGVPSNKVVMGVPSFGRSYKMTDENCRDPTCTHIGGTDSTATPGRCTKTAGLLANSEIEDIIKQNKGLTNYDNASDTDILIYDKDNWVSYMSKSTKKKRADFYKSMNFGGVSDWAVDLA